MNDYRQSDSSEEIKADIEQTRAQMENKINQIQSKLDPERLMEQAQETVRSMVTDSSSAVMGYMREHREEIGASMLDAVKRNPVPAALIGLGLGWLALESMSPRRERYDYDRNRHLPVPRDEAVRYESGYSYDNRYAGPSNWNEEQWNAYGRTPTYGEWQGSSSPEHQRYAASGTAPYYGVDRPYSGGYAGQEPQDRSRLQEAKEQVVGQAQNVAESVKDAAQTVGEKAGDAVDAVRDAVSHAGERVRSGAEHLADRARDEAEQMGYQTRSRAGQFGHEMGYRGQAMGMQARQMGRRIENQVEDNPMMIGAVAFAVGAAVAMLMPQSRVENRYIGEARDRVMESAKELGQDVGERAQRVVEEVRPELEQSAKKLVEEVKQVGKEAAQDLQHTAQKAQEKAKQEGEGLKATAEGKANQAAAQLKAPENWTTLKGRWNEIKGEAKRQWGKLTDDDLTRIEGDYDKLVGLIQQKYGYSRSQAEQEIGTFSRSRV